MSFQDFPEQQPVVQLLQRSLARGRLGHGYLLNGSDLDELERLARTLAKTLNCLAPPLQADNGMSLDSCDRCLNCRKIADGNHADVQWVRPESKTRIITIDQVRELMHTVQMKPTEAEFKFGIVVAADRLNPLAANAFLKTLEEPPAKSVLLLLSTEPQRLLETIQSRCLRLNFGGESGRRFDPVLKDWLAVFSQQAMESKGGLFSRYRLLGLVLRHLHQVRSEVEKTLSERSPLEKFEDAEAKLRERWEDELNAAIEAEYRHRRANLFQVLQWWLRDVWLLGEGLAEPVLAFPEFADRSRTLASRLKPEQAVENLRNIERMQRLLHSNVQEALCLEVGLLKFSL